MKLKIVNSLEIKLITSILIAADLRGAGLLRARAASSLALILSASALAHFSLVLVSTRLLRFFLRSSGRPLLDDSVATTDIKESILGAGVSDQTVASSLWLASTTVTYFSSPSRVWPQS